jgi:hypothetical protein
MSKRKRASKPAPDESGDDASAKDDMVHVTPDLLAGSPDIFASKKKPAEVEAPSVGDDRGTVTETIEPETSVEPPADAPVEAKVEVPEEPIEEPAAMTAAEPAPTLAPEEPAAPTPPAPPFVSAQPYPTAPRRGGSSGAALGMVLIVVGIFALVVVVAGVDLTQYGWPLFVIIPGLTLLIVGFIAFGQAATIPGGVITVLGLVLAYQSSTGDWPSWAYVWALIVPGGVGLGMYLQALRDRDQHALRTGRTLMFIGVMIFVIGFVLFESILGISGRDYGIAGKAALPGLLIVIGAILLWRSVQRARRT